jgi:transcriptional regulator with XRE-family HTH domain
MHVKPEEAFGQILRELRGKKGLTQEKLALEANLDRTFISLLERGLRQPSLTTIFDIAAILRIPTSHLMELVEEAMESGGRKNTP